MQTSPGEMIYSAKVELFPMGEREEDCEQKHACKMEKEEAAVVDENWTAQPKNQSLDEGTKTDLLMARRLCQREVGERRCQRDGGERYLIL